MKQLITEIWNPIMCAKRSELTYRQIYRKLVQDGFPGTFNTFYRCCQEVAKMMPAQRVRLVKS